MLEAQHVGTNHLSETPTVRPTVEITKPQKLTSEPDSEGKKVDGGQHIVGFVHPKHDEEDENDVLGDGQTEEEVQVHVILAIIHVLMRSVRSKDVTLVVF